MLFKIRLIHTICFAGPPKNGEIALQTPQTDIFPCHQYCYGIKSKAKDITGTSKLVYHIKRVNGLPKKNESLNKLIESDHFTPPKPFTPPTHN